MHPAELLVHTLRLGGGFDAGGLAAQWREAGTTGLVRLVEFEQCALWLERRLRQIGASALTERDFASWLRERAHAETARNLLVDAQVAAVARLLAEWDVPHVFLKGTARRAASDLYPFADARATHDVDVLVPATHAPAVWDGAAIWAGGAPFDWGEIHRRLAAGEAGPRARAGGWLGAAAWLAGAGRPSAIADDMRHFDVPAAVRRRWRLLRHIAADGRVGELLCWWTNAWGPPPRPAMA